MPRTLGDTNMHVERLHYIVPVNEPICEHAMGQMGDAAVVEKIAGHIVGLIPDGATMQLGIGAIPDAVLKHLYTKKDLGIHTELFSDGVINLVEAGVITNARKTLHPGKIVAGFLLGTRRLYDWVNNNPLVEFYRTEYVNDPFVVAQNDRMVAINSALEVDLTGQVCADSIGPRQYSAVGGQLDFVYGAIYLPRVFDYLLEANGEWYGKFLGISWLEQNIRKRGQPFLHVTCDILSRVVSGQQISLMLTVSRLGRSSISYAVQGYDENGTHCISAQLTACYSVEQNGALKAHPSRTSYVKR